MPLPPRKSTALAGARVDLLIYLALVLATFAVYAQVRDFDFVNYDDFDFISDNLNVRNGLTAGPEVGSDLCFDGVFLCVASPPCTVRGLGSRAQRCAQRMLLVPHSVAVCSLCGTSHHRPTGSFNSFQL